MKLKTKTTHGGKREGSGRKSKNLKNFNLKIENETYLKILKEKNKTDKTWNDFLLDLIQRNIVSDLLGKTKKT